MLDGPLCTVPHQSTSGLTLYKTAGSQLRHLRWRHSPIGMSLPYGEPVLTRPLVEGGKVDNGGIPGGASRKALIMDGHLGDTLAISNLGTTRSRAWMYRVITLVEGALGQLHSPVHPAQSTLLEAASLLRQQIGPPAARKVSDGRGRLLAWQARKVREYIDSHITESVLVADLCAILQRSEAHFSRSFKRTFGESPHAFLVRRRVEFAAQYMLTTDAALSDIALRCGFTDQAHLCRQFRQAAGQTPAAWRRAHRSHDDEQLRRDESSLAAHSAFVRPPDKACDH
jgi:AraC family transcriptional regulator